MEPAVHVEPARCPFCHEEIPRGGGEAPTVCPACHALHHAACFAEHGRCAACNKVMTRAVARPARRLPWTVDAAVGAVAGGLLAALLSPHLAPILLGAVFGGMVGGAVGRERE